jgi:hypothetical protein
MMFLSLVSKRGHRQISGKKIIEMVAAEPERLKKGLKAPTTTHTKLAVFTLYNRSAWFDQNLSDCILLSRETKLACRELHLRQ